MGADARLRVAAVRAARHVRPVARGPAPVPSSISWLFLVVVTVVGIAFGVLLAEAKRRLGW